MKLRFVGMLIIIAVASVGAAVLYLIFTNQEVSSDCTPFLQEEIVEGFKGDAFVIGVIAAIGAWVAYGCMLRYQVFFPRNDAWRFFSAAIVCGLLGLVTTLLGVTYLGSDCLATALGPDSAIPESVAQIRSLAGRFIGNVWIAVGLDQLVLAGISVALARLLREFRFRVG